MKAILRIFALPLFLIACSSTSLDEQAIKKELESRYTGFEIVEIRKDSAEVSNATAYSNSCKIVISSNNLELAKAKGRYYGKEYDYPNVHNIKPWPLDKVMKYADSVSHESFELVNAYMNLQFSKSQPCYYVKYRVFDGANKVEKEEYYQYRDGANEWVHRPCDWDDFLQERGDANLLEESMADYKKLLLDIMYGDL
jgi:hypothetical protein